MSSSAATGSGRGRARRTRSTKVDEWVARFESPMTTYYLLLGIIGLNTRVGANAFQVWGPAVSHQDFATAVATAAPQASTADTTSGSHSSPSTDGGRPVSR